MTQPIPEQYHSVTALLAVENGAEALDFYQRAFGAELLSRLEGGGRIMHSELRIGDSVVMVSDEMPESGNKAPDPDGPVPVSMLIYSEDVDALYARAIAAGATEVNPPSDQFHGDRAGSLRDPFGHRWMIATRIEDVSHEEVQRRLDEWMASSG